MSCSAFADEKVAYEVLNAETLANEKMSIDVVVSRPIDEEQLSRVARIIHKALKGISFKRVFMTWYLPGMEIDAGAWATTHFDPRLKITITNWMLEYNPPAEAFR